MGFAGLKKDDERANLIAYLRTLADSPRSAARSGARRRKALPRRPRALPAGGCRQAGSEGAAPAEAGTARPLPRDNDKIVILAIMKKPGSARLFHWRTSRVRRRNRPGPVSLSGE